MIGSSKISIITPVKGRTDLFQQTYESVIGQTNSDWEWIIIDDGSPERDFCEIEKMCKSADRVLYIKRDNNGCGASYCRNIGVNKANGEWLIFLDADCDVERAYIVIKRNRQERGFPLRMTLQDVLATRKIINADFFVMSYEGIDVAAAQVFHVAKDIAQVIYWGDLPQYSHLRTMNYFTYKVFEYYSQTNIQILDIGPSTEDGVPNYGLCEFKENIGCEVTLKHTLLI